MLSETPFNPTGISVDAQADLLSFTTTKDQVSSSMSPLLRAASWGFDEIIQKFIDKGSDLTETDLKGETALHKAARFAQLSVAVRLLRAGVEVDAVDRLGMTALHWAALNGNVQLTRLLLIHQADPTLQDYFTGGMTPGEMAQLMGHDIILDILERYRWAVKP